VLFVLIDDLGWSDLGCSSAANAANNQAQAMAEADR
jgi:arylsulfatase A-like enzyme